MAVVEILVWFVWEFGATSGICSEHSRNCGCGSRNASTVCVRFCYGESLLVPGGCHWLVAGAWWVGEFGATVHGVVVEMLVRSV